MNLDMLTQYFHFHFAGTFDIQLAELNDFAFTGANITGFSVVDPGTVIHYPAVVNMISNATRNYRKNIPVNILSKWRAGELVIPVLILLLFIFIFINLIALMINFIIITIKSNIISF